MKKLNIALVGKTGCGKTTIVETLLGVYKGSTVRTNKNKLYNTTCKIGGKQVYLNLYDTVGIELNEEINRFNFQELEAYLKKTKLMSSPENISLVWFCIEGGGSRIEDYEIKWIRKLSRDYEIPFIIVLTKCLDKGACELEKKINEIISEITTVKILVQDYEIVGNRSIKAYGMDNLLDISLNCHNTLKNRILEAKLKSIEESLFVSEATISSIEEKASRCCKKHVRNAKKIGWIPVLCIPFVYDIFVKMVGKLHEIYGLPTNKDFVKDIATYSVAGLILTPLMVIPVLSWAVATAYIETAGEKYCKALSYVLKKSRYGELSNQRLMAERIKRQVDKM